MKKILVFITLLHGTLFCSAQKQHQAIIAVGNTNSAMPFGKFIKLFGNVFHPAFEMGDSFNWKTGKKRDWFQQVKLGYFSHRFVQNAIILYTESGYRYKMGSRLEAEATIGAGYLHSIPATDVYRIDKNGDYKNAKGIGRPQAMADLSFGLAYRFFPNKFRPVRVFLTYQQRIQFPFVKSYVPLLPYNSILLGVSAPFLSIKK